MPNALILVENASVPTDPRVWPECQSLRRAGWNVTVICPKGRGRDTAAAEVVDGVEIHRFDAMPSSGGALGYLREYGSAFVRITQLVRRLRRGHSFDVVHACSPPDLLLLTVLPGRRGGAGTILDHHDLSPELFRAKFGRGGTGYLAVKLAERLGFALADVVLSTNESFREIALSRGHKRPEDVFVVRNGPDPNVFRPVEPDAALRQKAMHLIGYVGLMESQDGVEDAVRALAELRQHRTDWHALLVGDGEALPSAKSLVARLGIAEHVTFTGFVNDRSRIVQIIASCDVCLSPEPRNQLNERSTLIKVAEYMAVGRPVVAYDLRETRRTAGEAAAYAPSDEPTSLAATVSVLLDDPERRERMGAIGRERVERALTWEHSERALLSAYERAALARLT